MITLLVIVLVYVLPLICGYFYIRALHSSNGIYKNLNAGSWDMFLIFCPMINIGGIFMWAVVWPYKRKRKRKRRKFDYNKFFGIKKDLDN